MIDKGFFLPFRPFLGHFWKNHDFHTFITCTYIFQVSWQRIIDIARRKWIWYQQRNNVPGSFNDVNVEWYLECIFLFDKRTFQHIIIRQILQIYLSCIESHLCCCRILLQTWRLYTNLHANYKLWTSWIDSFRNYIWVLRLFSSCIHIHFVDLWFRLEEIYQSTLAKSCTCNLFPYYGFCCWYIKMLLWKQQ